MVSTEKLMQDLGIPFEKKEVRLADVIVKAVQQVRDQTVDARTVEEYAAAYLSEDEPPPPITVSRNGAGTYHLELGFHRFPAMKQAGFETAEMYVIPPGLTAEQLFVLRVKDNKANGLRYTAAESARHVLELARMKLYTHDQIAEIVGTSARTVRQLVASEKAVQRAIKVDRAVLNLPKKSQIRLNNLRGDKVYAAAAEVVRESGMDSKETGEFVTRINAIRDEADQLAEVARIKESYAANIQASRVSDAPLLRDFRRGLRTLQSTAAKPRFREELWLKLDAETRAGLLSETDKTLRQVRGAFKAAETP